MSVRHQDTSITSIGQSPGCDPKNSKRSSGLFSFFKWFKASTSRESVTQESSSSSSCDSLNSISSTGTIASFSFISPIDYKAEVSEKNITQGPETDTYRARLKQRDKRRENDKNVTLRKKYNLFFNRDTIPKPTTNLLEEIDNSKSLPLMTKKAMKAEDEEKIHRRTNSESSKLKKAGAYCHVKGKRKAPPPPSVKLPNQEGTSTMSLRRKKRLAPQPPAIVSPDKVYNSLEKVNDFDNIEYADADVIFNDSLKLDHGVLKPVKLAEKRLNKSSSSITEQPVSPRPWYKRSLNRDSGINFKKDKDNKYEPIELGPDKNCKSSKASEKANKKKEDKRKSGISFLTNISELDREALEIIKKENKNENENEDFEPPMFMRPRHETIKTNSDSWISPKRKSAKDLIAKFNAITNVTKVTVNSAFFGAKESGVLQKDNLKRDYFGISSAIQEEPLKHTETEFTESKATKFIPLMKSESAVVVKTSHKLENKEVKVDRKSWFCPKCSLENDYWRIICSMCSTIKPYFDDLTSTPVKNISLENNKTQNLEIKHFPPNTNNTDLTKNTTQAKYNSNVPLFEKHLERSKTQIGFSALAKFNNETASRDNKKFLKSASVEEKPKGTGDRQEEKERLKKMLIEMKNSLPKKRFNFPEKNNNRASVIQENTEAKESDEVKINDTLIKSEKDDTRVAEVVIATTETIYENIKVKKVENPKPVKISSSAQTSTAAQKEIVPPNILEAVNKKRGSESIFELLRPKDFANIYSVKTDKPEHHIYTNLMEDKQDFFNVAMKFNEIKNSVANNTDTLEVNRLLKRLETAIGRGELTEASQLARDLAQLKINCSVVRQKSIDNNEKPQNTFTVNMYVEDKVSHRGPFPIQVTESQTVAQLKTQVETEFQIPVQVQRWILGKKLVADDGATMKDLNVKTEGCSIFLYLVASTNETKKEVTNKLEDKVTGLPDPQPSCSRKPDEAPKFEIKDTNVASTSKESPIIVKEETKPLIAQPVLPPVTDHQEDFDTKTLKANPKNWECIMCTFLNLQNNNTCAICATVRKIPTVEQKVEVIENLPKNDDANKDEHYKELLNLDNADLVENTEPFECLVCLSEIESHQGVTLRDCLHQFCKPCLTNTIEFTDEAEIKCPYRDDEYSCDILLQDREIKALLTAEMYDQFLAKSIAQAENKMDKSFHCKTPDCRGWCIFEDNVNYFHCPVCRKVNCLTCQAIHMGMNCKQYQESLLGLGTDENSLKTKEMLEEMVNKGEAINCPTCQVILMKKWGCDWLRCSMCKTEICWVTRGPRWGPAGKGDTSGGCKCGLNGVKCHPQCNYCH